MTPALMQASDLLEKAFSTIAYCQIKDKQKLFLLLEKARSKLDKRSSELPHEALVRDITGIQNSIEKSIKKLKVKKDLYDFADLTKQNILTLAENGIITLDDLAELDSEELFNILGKDVFANEDDAGSIIMKAREHWFSEIDSEK